MARSIFIFRKPLFLFGCCNIAEKHCKRKDLLFHANSFANNHRAVVVLLRCRCFFSVSFSFYFLRGHFVNQELLKMHNNFFFSLFTGTSIQNWTITSCVGIPVVQASVPWALLACKGLVPTPITVTPISTHLVRPTSVPFG